MYLKIFYSLVILILFGMAYQYVVTKIESNIHKAPGKMVDIGGVKLHIHEMGQEHEGPVIVLDMGIGGNMLYWNGVQEEIAQFAHVVSFDRAGIGWSEKSPFERTSYNIIEETRKLLKASGIKGPYIIVGHSFGGLNARIYAKKYKDEVAGIVLVDSSHEDQENDLPRSKAFMNRVLDTHFLHPFISGLSKVGGIRLYRFFSGDSENFSPDRYKVSKAKESSNKFIDTLLEEWRLFGKNLEYARRFDRDLGDIPVTVVTAAMDISKEACELHGHYDMDRCRKGYKVWHDLQKDLTTRSTNSKQILAKNSAHIVHHYEPELVVEAVRDMLSNITRAKL